MGNNMTAIKNKQELIDKINDIITNQSKKRESKNTFTLKKLGYSINSYKFIDSKEKKLVDDTIKVLIDFYNDNVDINKNPNKLPNNFFKKILEDISSTDSDIDLDAKNKLSQKQIDNESNKEDIEKETIAKESGEKETIAEEDIRDETAEKETIEGENIGDETAEKETIEEDIGDETAEIETIDETVEKETSEKNERENIE